MDIQNKPTLEQKQAFWKEQLPNFEAKYWLPSHFEFLVFDMDQGNYVIKDGLDPRFDDDAVEIWHRVNTGWAMWKKAINFSKTQAVPEGFVSVESSELEQLKLDSEYFEKSCVEWTNRAYEQRAKVDLIKNEVERFKQSGTSLDLEYFLESLIELSTFKRDAELFKVWQETKAIPEGFVLLSHEDVTRIMSTIDFLGVKALGDNYMSFSEIHKIVEEWQEQRTGARA